MFHYAPGGVARPRHDGQRLAGDALIAQLLASRPNLFGPPSHDASNHSEGVRAVARALVDQDDRRLRRVHQASLGSPAAQSLTFDAIGPHGAAGMNGPAADMMRTGADPTQRQGLPLRRPQEEPALRFAARRGGRGRGPARTPAQELLRDRIIQLQREIRKLNPKVTFVEPLHGSHSARALRTLEAILRRLQKEAANEADIRFRHYTTDKGLEGIKRDQIIRAKDKNRVHGENARKKPLSPRDAEDKYKIDKGHGNNFVETDVEASRVENYKNPRTKRHELRVKGDLELRNPDYRWRRR